MKRIFIAHILPRKDVLQNHLSVAGCNFCWNLIEGGVFDKVYSVLPPFINEPTLKSKACLKCLYFTKIISDLCRNLECFSYLYTINQTE